MKMKRLLELIDYFKQCGYPFETMLKPIMERVLTLERDLSYNTKSDDKPFLIPFFQTYGKGAMEIKKYVDVEVNKALKDSVLYKPFKKPIIKTVFKKGASIRSLVFTKRK